VTALPAMTKDPVAGDRDAPGNVDGRTPITRGFRSQAPGAEPEGPRAARLVRHDRFPAFFRGANARHIKVTGRTLALQAEGSLIGKWSWGEFEAPPQITLKTVRIPSVHRMQG
jgi:hypothetical protein